MIERSRVRIPAGTAGEFSSPGSTFCADSYFGIRSTPRVTTVARKKSRSFCQKCRWQVTAKHAYTLRIEPCFGIGHSLSLICQMTSEDIKHHSTTTTTELICSMKVEVAVLGSPSLTALNTISVNVKQRCTRLAISEVRSLALRIFRAWTKNL